MTVKDGEKEIGHTGASAYLCWEREPANTTISSKAENTSTVDLKVEKDMVYYIRQSVLLGFFKARNKIELISKEEALKLLKDCKPPTVALPKEKESAPEKGTKIEP